jgi:hypothetical protein
METLCQNDHQVAEAFQRKRSHPFCEIFPLKALMTKEHQDASSSILTVKKFTSVSLGAGVAQLVQFLTTDLTTSVSLFILSDLLI